MASYRRRAAIWSNKTYSVKIHSSSNASANSKSFTYKEGTKVTVTFNYTGDKVWIKNASASSGGGANVHFKINGSDRGAVFEESNNIKTFTFTVTGDTDIELTNTDYSNFGNVTSMMTLSPADTSVKVKAPRKILSGTSNKLLGEDKPVKTVENEADKPAAREGYDINTDADDVKTWELKVTLPDNESWEKTVSGLEKFDDHGNPYVYYMATASEYGVPESTVAVITSEGGKLQVVYGDSQAELKDKVLSMTNTIPAVKEFEAQKAWKHGILLLQIAAVWSFPTPAAPEPSDAIPPAFSCLPQQASFFCGGRAGRKRPDLNYQAY